MIIFILGGLIVLVAGVVVVLMVVDRMKKKGKDNDTGKGTKENRKDRDTTIKQPMKRLAKDPRDPEALTQMGNIYFEDEKWDKAIRIYEILITVAKTDANKASFINVFEATQRYGLCALKLDKKEAAYKAFTAAWNMRKDNLEVDYNLGVMEYQRQNYEKATNMLSLARKIDPDHAATLRYLGYVYFKLGKRKEAANLIKRAVEINPGDKEALYTLAECYYETEQVDQALKIFSRLRPDPAMGPNACLFSGTINVNQHQNVKAIEDFEIGLRHTNIKHEVRLELQYRLGMVYLKQNEIGKALALFKGIHDTESAYKDVDALIAKYQEIYSNKNLQIYTMGSSADFAALCRKIVLGYFPKSSVKITSVSLEKNEWADILAEIDTPKWSDTIMFRFIRDQGTVGELIVRDFHSHLKDVKAGKGVCITMGKFGEEARHYTEARLIDLIEREKLIPILNTVDARVMAAASASKKKGHPTAPK
jgi:tetratricopeptide (TPR) repeat protein